MMDIHEKYMSRCLELAKLSAGMTAPNPMVGAVLVYENRIIGEGYHQKYGLPHAEVNCIGSVKEEDRHLIPYSTIYVSLEPCAHFGKTPPCADLIIKNKILKVVVGCRDPFTAVNGKGIEKLKAAGIDVEMSQLHKECIFLNRRFFTFHICKRPYIILKWAQSSDGFIAPINQKERLLISNDISNRLVHKWRSEEAGILVGANTAILDNPTLTNRHWTGGNPIRIATDNKDSIPSTHHLLDDSIPTVIFSKNTNRESNGNTTFIPLVEEQDTIVCILEYCFENDIQSILVEGGSKLHQSFIGKGLWDEIRIITNKDMIIGDGVNAPVIHKSFIIEEHTNIDNNSIDYIYNNQEKIY